MTDRDRIGIRFWTEYSHGTALSNQVGVFRRVIAGRRGVLDGVETNDRAL
jgi:hypothetical protein